MKKCQPFKIVQINSPGTTIYDDYEGFVLTYSRNISEINGKPNISECAKSDSIIEGLVKICHNGESAYRKVRARAGISAGEIAMGYRTRALLKAKPGDSVCVKRTNWLSYIWHHYDSSIKLPFRCAIIFGSISIILNITPLLQLSY